MARYGGDVRPLSGWARVRTICHGCRAVSYEVAAADVGVTLVRPVVVAGDGSMTQLVAAVSVSGELGVVLPCPDCGSSDTPGWRPGFALPV